MEQPGRILALEQRIAALEARLPQTGDGAAPGSDAQAAPPPPPTTPPPTHRHGPVLFNGKPIKVLRGGTEGPYGINPGHPRRKPSAESQQRLTGEEKGLPAVLAMVLRLRDSFLQAVADIMKNRREIAMLWAFVKRIRSAPDGSSGSFPVFLVNSGGSAGDASTFCTFTYDVFTPDANTLLASGVAVEGSRFIKAAYNPASHGIAYLDSGQTLKLSWVDEYVNTNVCDPE